MKLEEVEEIPQENTALKPPAKRGRKKKERINQTTAAEGFAFLWTLIAKVFGYDYEWQASDFQRSGKDFAENVGEHADFFLVAILIFIVARAATIKELYDRLRELIGGIRHARMLRKAKQESIETQFEMVENNEHTESAGLS
jgi:hypothetical protein